ncbi:MAG: hypothetical protein R6U95_03620 [Bacteroidales bacterium]
MKSFTVYAATFVLCVLFSCTQKETKESVKVTNPQSIEKEIEEVNKQIKHLDTLSKEIDSSVSKLKDSLKK